MKVIYQPKGRALEYSPLAVNLYTGCNHGCKYCYAPAIMRLSKEDFKKVHKRSNIIRNFEADAKLLAGSDKPILFCFMTDPYNALESTECVTRSCLEIALKYNLRIRILTKALDLPMRDMDLFTKFKDRISIGVTMTFFDIKDSLKWEPGASSPPERIALLKNMKTLKVPTWASFEPVINPRQSLMLMDEILDCCDHFKIGKLNNFQGLDKKIDWSDFLSKTVNKLRMANKSFYIKDDLRLAAPNIKLNPIEVKNE